MTTKRVFIFLAGILLVASCGKGVPFDGAKIYTVYSVKGNYTTVFTYNSDGSVASIVVDNSTRTAFQYNGNNVLQDIGVGHIINESILYTKNSAGNADTGQGAKSYMFDSYEFSWDDNSQISSKKYYVSHVLQSSLIYYFVNKNLYKIDSEDVSSGIHYYDYFTYLPNNSNSLGVQNQGEFFFGASSANLMANDVKITGSGTDTTDILTYHYRYDGNGFVDTIAVWSRGGALLDSNFYTYY